MKTIYRLVLEYEKKNSENNSRLSVKIDSQLCLVSIYIDSDRSNSKISSRSLTRNTSTNYVGIDVERGKSQDDLVTHFPYGIVGIG